ncbi:MAG: hypothetical protein P4L53_18375 [Candidatus Obscuribacterales bacterium]|nr:hypothetical protein [Candidatus Obscuribacterales bacterium]
MTSPIQSAVVLDKLGRVTDVFFESGASQSFQYDALGNRISTNVVVAANAFVSNGFRLSLSPTDPIPSADITGANTGYLVPLTSSLLTLLSSTGTIFTDDSLGAAIPLSFSGMVAGNVYRIFASDPTQSGTISLSAVAWTNPTTPGSAAALAPASKGGFLASAGNATLRYIGDVYCNTTAGLVNDSAADRGVFNNENRAFRQCTALDPGTWSFSSTTTRARNNNTTEGVGRFGVLFGNDPEAFQIEAQAYGLGTTTNVYYSVGFGVDSITTFTGSLLSNMSVTVSGTRASGTLNYQPVIGRHYFQALEQIFSLAPGTVTTYTYAPNTMNAIVRI